MVASVYSASLLCRVTEGSQSQCVPEATSRRLMDLGQLHYRCVLVAEVVPQALPGLRGVCMGSACRPDWAWMVCLGAARSLRCWKRPQLLLTGGEKRQFLCHMDLSGLFKFFSTW